MNSEPSTTRELLFDLLYQGLLMMRSCGRRGDSHTVAQLANMFHNLPGALRDATTPADFDRILDEMWRLCPDGTAREWLHHQLEQYGVDPDRYAPRPPQITVPWPSNKLACPLCRGSAVRAARVVGTVDEFFVCPVCESVWLSRAEIGYETAVYLVDFLRAFDRAPHEYELLEDPDP